MSSIIRSLTRVRARTSAASTRTAKLCQCHAPSRRSISSGTHARYSPSSSSSSVPLTPTDKPSSGTQLLISIFVASVVSGLVGYSFSGNNSKDSAGSASSAAELNDNYFKNAKYGSKDDFKKAIQELQDAFKQDGREDIVDTTPDVLDAHGFSFVNAYHEGTVASQRSSTR